MKKHIIKIISTVLIISFSMNQISYAAAGDFSALRPAASRTSIPIESITETLRGQRIYQVSPEYLHDILRTLNGLISQQSLPEGIRKEAEQLKSIIEQRIQKTPKDSSDTKSKKHAPGHVATFFELLYKPVLEGKGIRTLSFKQLRSSVYIKRGKKRHMPGFGTSRYELNHLVNSGLAIKEGTGEDAQYTPIINIAHKAVIEDLQKALSALKTNARRGEVQEVVKGVIESHSGTIEAESELGKGTTFTIRLPAAEEKDKKRTIPVSIEPTGFELGPEEERAQIRARNQEYLKSKGWWDEIKLIRYRPRFIEEEPDLPAIMDRIAQEIKRDENLRRNIVVPMIVHPDDIPKVTDDEINRTIKNHIKSFAYLLQSIFFYSQGKQTEASETYQKALKQAEKEFPRVAQEREQTIQKILESIRAIKNQHLRQTAEKAWLETIPMLRQQMEQGPAKRVGLLGFFGTGVISDDLYKLAEDVYMSSGELTRTRYLFTLGLDLYDVKKKSYHVSKDFALNLAFFELHTNPEARGAELLQSVLGTVHGEFTRWSQVQASSKTRLGEELRAHYRQTRDRTMEASSHVKKIGTAVVLGAGSFVVLPLVEMLREELPDRTLKYEKIILVELGEGLSEQALDDLVRKGAITKEEASRVEVVRSDASLILKGITSRIDEIMFTAAKKKPKKFPKKEITQLFKEIADPKQFVRFALPISERPFSDESVTFVVFAMAAQDFASPIMDYIDIWTKYFKIGTGDWETSRQWHEAYSNQVQRNIAGLVIEDLSRISTPQGIIFLADGVGLQVEPYLDRKGERKDFYGPEGLKELVPKNLPLKIVSRASWLRPLNVEEYGKDEKHNFIIESLALRKIKPQTLNEPANQPLSREKKTPKDSSDTKSKKHAPGHVATFFELLYKPVLEGKGIRTLSFKQLRSSVYIKRGKKRHMPGFGTSRYELNHLVNSGLAIKEGTGEDAQYTPIINIAHKAVIEDLQKALSALKTNARRGEVQEVVKGVIESHSGTIEAESELGKGTTFTIRLPISEAPPKSASDDFASGDFVTEPRQRIMKRCAEDKKELFFSYGRLPDEHPVTVYVRELFEEAMGDEAKDYNVVIAPEWHEINAIALPDGTIIISRALLEFVKYRQELKALLIHEAIHIKRKHLELVEEVIGSSEEAKEAKEAIRTILCVMSIKRLQEYEADLRWIFEEFDKRNVNPLGLQVFLERLASYERERGGYRPKDLAHGGLEDRALNVESIFYFLDLSSLSHDLEEIPESFRQQLQTIPLHKRVHFWGGVEFLTGKELERVQKERIRTADTLSASHLEMARKAISELIEKLSKRINETKEKGKIGKLKERARVNRAILKKLEERIAREKIAEAPEKTKPDTGQPGEETAKKPEEKLKERWEKQEELEQKAKEITKEIIKRAKFKKKFQPSDYNDILEDIVRVVKDYKLDLKDIINFFFDIQAAMYDILAYDIVKDGWEQNFGKMMVVRYALFRVFEIAVKGFTKFMTLTKNEREALMFNALYHFIYNMEGCDAELKQDEKGKLRLVENAFGMDTKDAFEIRISSIGEWEYEWEDIKILVPEDRNYLNQRLVSIEEVWLEPERSRQDIAELYHSLVQSPLSWPSARVIVRGMPGKLFNKILAKYLSRYGSWKDFFEEIEALERAGVPATDIIRRDRYSFGLALSRIWTTLPGEPNLRQLEQVSTAIDFIANPFLRLQFQTYYYERLWPKLKFNQKLDALFSERSGGFFDFRRFHDFIEEEAKTRKEFHSARDRLKNEFDSFMAKGSREAGVATIFSNFSSDPEFTQPLIEAMLKTWEDDSDLKDVIYEVLYEFLKKEEVGEEADFYRIRRIKTKIEGGEAILQHLYMMDNAGKYILLRKILTGEKGLLSNKEHRARFLNALINTTVESDSESKLLTIIKEVVEALGTTSSWKQVYFALQSLLFDRLVIPPESSSHWENIPSVRDDLSRVYSPSMRKKFSRRGSLTTDITIERLGKKGYTRFPWRYEAGLLNYSENMLRKVLTGRGIVLHHVDVGQLNPPEFVIEFAQHIGALGVRFLQLLPQFLDLPEEYQDKFSRVYDSIYGQSKLTALAVLEREWPDLWENIVSIEERVGGGSLATVYRVKAADGKNEVIKVLNPNLEYHLENSVELIGEVLDELVRRYGEKYSFARLAVDEVKEWIKRDVNFEGFIEKDKKFREDNNGFTQDGFDYKMYVPQSYGPENRFFLREEFVEGRNLTEWKQLEQEGHDLKQVVSLIVKNYTSQLREGFLHSDIHVGNFRVTPDKKVAILDRNFFLELTPEMRDLINTLLNPLMLFMLSPEELLDKLAAISETNIPASQRDNLIQPLGDFIEDIRNGNYKSISKLLVDLRQDGLKFPIEVALIFKNINSLQQMAKRAGFDNIVEAYLYSRPESAVLPDSPKKSDELANQPLSGEKFPEPAFTELHKLQSKGVKKIEVINEMVKDRPTIEIPIDRAIWLAQTRQLFFEDGKFYLFGGGVSDKQPKKRFAGQKVRGSDFVNLESLSMKTEAVFSGNYKSPFQLFFTPFKSLFNNFKHLLFREKMGTQDNYSRRLTRRIMQDVTKVQITGEQNPSFFTSKLKYLFVLKWLPRGISYIYNIKAFFLKLVQEGIGYISVQKKFHKGYGREMGTSSSFVSRAANSKHAFISSLVRGGYSDLIFSGVNPKDKASKTTYTGVRVPFIQGFPCWMLGSTEILSNNLFKSTLTSPLLIIYTLSLIFRQGNSSASPHNLLQPHPDDMFAVTPQERLRLSGYLGAREENLHLGSRYGLLSGGPTKRFADGSKKGDSQEITDRRYREALLKDEPVVNDYMEMLFEMNLELYTLAYERLAIESSIKELEKELAQAKDARIKKNLRAKIKRRKKKLTKKKRAITRLRKRAEKEIREFKKVKYKGPAIKRYEDYRGKAKRHFQNAVAMMSRENIDSETIKAFRKAMDRAINNIRKDREWLLERRLARRRKAMPSRVRREKGKIIVVQGYYVRKKGARTPILVRKKIKYDYLWDARHARYHELDFEAKDMKWLIPDLNEIRDVRDTLLVYEKRPSLISEKELRDVRRRLNKVLKKLKGVEAEEKRFSRIALERAIRLLNIRKIDTARGLLKMVARLFEKRRNSVEDMMEYIKLGRLQGLQDMARDRNEDIRRRADRILSLLQSGKNEKALNELRGLKSLKWMQEPEYDGLDNILRSSVRSVESGRINMGLITSTMNIVKTRADNANTLNDFIEDYRDLYDLWLLGMRQDLRTALDVFRFTFQEYLSKSDRIRGRPDRKSKESREKSCERVRKAPRTFWTRFYQDAFIPFRIDEPTGKKDSRGKPLRIFNPTFQAVSDIILIQLIPDLNEILTTLKKKETYKVKDEKRRRIKKPARIGTANLLKRLLKPDKKNFAQFTIKERRAVEKALAGDYGLKAKELRLYNSSILKISQLELQRRLSKAFAIEEALATVFGTMTVLAALKGLWWIFGTGVIGLSILVGVVAWKYLKLARENVVTLRYHFRIDSIIRSYRKAVLSMPDDSKYYIAPGEEVLEVIKPGHPDYEKNQRRIRKIKKAINILREKGFTERADRLENVTTILGLTNMKTYLLFSDGKRGVFRAIHPGRRRNVLYMSMRLIDNLRINRRQDMEFLAAGLNKEQRFIDAYNSLAEQEKVNPLEWARRMHAIREEESVISIDEKEKSICPPEILDRRLRELADKDVQIRSDEIFPEIEKEMNEAEGLEFELDIKWTAGVDIARVSEFKDDYVKLANLYGVIGYRWENLGNRKQATKFYRKKIAIIKYIQKFEKGVWPIEIQEELVYLLLHEGLYREFLNELRTLLNGKGFPRPLEKEEEYIRKGFLFLHFDNLRYEILYILVAHESIASWRQRRKIDKIRRKAIKLFNEYKEQSDRELPDERESSSGGFDEPRVALKRLLDTIGEKYPDTWFDDISNLNAVKMGYRGNLAIFIKDIEINLEDPKTHPSVAYLALMGYLEHPSVAALDRHEWMIEDLKSRLPAIIEKKLASPNPKEKVLRIWDLGCGYIEPLLLASIILEEFDKHKKWGKPDEKIKIIINGVDIDETVGERVNRILEHGFSHKAKAVILKHRVTERKLDLVKRYINFINKPKNRERIQKLGIIKFIRGSAADDEHVLNNVVENADVVYMSYVLWELTDEAKIRILDNLKSIKKNALIYLRVHSDIADFVKRETERRFDVSYPYPPSDTHFLLRRGEDKPYDVGDDATFSNDKEDPEEKENAPLKEKINPYLELLSQGPTAAEEGERELVKIGKKYPAEVARRLGPKLAQPEISAGVWYILFRLARKSPKEVLRSLLWWLENEETKEVVQKLFLEIAKKNLDPVVRVLVGALGRKRTKGVEDTLLEIINKYRTFFRRPHSPGYNYLAAASTRGGHERKSKILNLAIKSGVNLHLVLTNLLHLTDDEVRTNAIKAMLEDPTIDWAIAYRLADGHTQVVKHAYEILSKKGIDPYEYLYNLPQTLKGWKRTLIVSSISRLKKKGLDLGPTPESEKKKTLSDKEKPNLQKQLPAMPGEHRRKALVDYILKSQITFNPLSSGEANAYIKQFQGFLSERNLTITNGYLDYEIDDILDNNGAVYSEINGIKWACFIDKTQKDAYFYLILKDGRAVGHGRFWFTPGVLKKMVDFMYYITPEQRKNLGSLSLRLILANIYNKVNRGVKVFRIPAAIRYKQKAHPSRFGPFRLLKRPEDLFLEGKTEESQFGGASGGISPQEDETRLPLRKLWSFGSDMGWRFLKTPGNRQRRGKTYRAKALKEKHNKEEEQLIKEFQDGFEKLKKKHPLKHPAHRRFVITVLRIAKALQERGAIIEDFVKSIKVEIDIEIDPSRIGEHTGVEADIIIKMKNQEGEDEEYLVKVRTGGRTAYESLETFFASQVRYKLWERWERYRIVAEKAGYAGVILAIDKPLPGYPAGKIVPLKGRKNFFIFTTTRIDKSVAEVIEKMDGTNSVSLLDTIRRTTNLSKFRPSDRGIIEAYYEQRLKELKAKETKPQPKQPKEVISTQPTAKRAKPPKVSKKPKRSIYAGIKELERAISQRDLDKVRGLLGIYGPKIRKKGKKFLPSYIKTIENAEKFLSEGGGAGTRNSLPNLSPSATITNRKKANPVIKKTIKEAKTLQRKDISKKYDPDKDILGGQDSESRRRLFNQPLDRTTQAYKWIKRDPNLINVLGAIDYFKKRNIKGWEKTLKKAVDRRGQLMVEFLGEFVEAKAIEDNVKYAHIIELGMDKYGPEIDFVLEVNKDKHKDKLSGEYEIDDGIYLGESKTFSRNYDLEKAIEYAVGKKLEKYKLTAVKMRKDSDAPVKGPVRGIIFAVGGEAVAAAGIHKFGWAEELKQDEKLNLLSLRAYLALIPETINAAERERLSQREKNYVDNMVSELKNDGMVEDADVLRAKDIFIKLLEKDGLTNLQLKIGQAIKKAGASPYSLKSQTKEVWAKVLDILEVEIIDVDATHYNDIAFEESKNKEIAIDRIERFIKAIEDGKFQDGNIVDLRDLPPDVEIILIGDLHARIDNLDKILEHRRVTLVQGGQITEPSLLEKVRNQKAILVILGDAIHYDFYSDYSDDEIENIFEFNGEDYEFKDEYRNEIKEIKEKLADMDTSIKIMQKIMELKIENPDYIYYLFGNHDSPFKYSGKWEVNQSEIYKREIQQRYGDEYLKLYRNFIDICPVMLLANGLVATHAGPVMEYSFDKTKDMRKDDTHLLDVILGRFNEYPYPGYWPYGRNDVKDFLQRMGQPDDAMFIVGHFPRVISEHSFYEKVMENHYIIYAAKDTTGYATFKKGKLDLVSVTAKPRGVGPAHYDDAAFSKGEMSPDEAKKNKIVEEELDLSSGDIAEVGIVLLAMTERPSKEEKILLWCTPKTEKEAEVANKLGFVETVSSGEIEDLVTMELKRRASTAKGEHVPSVKFSQEVMTHIIEFPKEITLSGQTLKEITLVTTDNYNSTQFANALKKCNVQVARGVIASGAVSILGFPMVIQNASSLTNLGRALGLDEEEVREYFTSLEDKTRMEEERKKEELLAKRKAEEERQKAEEERRKAEVRERQKRNLDAVSELIVAGKYDEATELAAKTESPAEHNHDEEMKFAVIVYAKRWLEDGQPELAKMLLETHFDSKTRSRDKTVKELLKQIETSLKAKEWAEKVDMVEERVAEIEKLLNQGFWDKAWEVVSQACLDYLPVYGIFEKLSEEVPQKARVIVSEWIPVEERKELVKLAKKYNSKVDDYSEAADKRKLSLWKDFTDILKQISEKVCQVPAAVWDEINKQAQEFNKEDPYLIIPAEKWPKSMTELVRHTGNLQRKATRDRDKISKDDRARAILRAYTSAILDIYDTDDPVDGQRRLERLSGERQRAVVISGVDYEGAKYITEEWIGDLINTVLADSSDKQRSTVVKNCWKQVKSRQKYISRYVDIPKSTDNFLDETAGRFLSLANYFRLQYTLNPRSSQTNKAARYFIKALIEPAYKDVFIQLRQLSAWRNRWLGQSVIEEFLEVEPLRAEDIKGYMFLLEQTERVLSEWRQENPSNKITVYAPWKVLTAWDPDAPAKEKPAELKLRRELWHGAIDFLIGYAWRALEGHRIYDKLVFVVNEHGNLPFTNLLIVYPKVGYRPIIEEKDLIALVNNEDAYVSAEVVPAYGEYPPHLLINLNREKGWEFLFNYEENIVPEGEEARLRIVLSDGEWIEYKNKPYQKLVRGGRLTPAPKGGTLLAEEIRKGRAKAAVGHILADGKQFCKAFLAGAKEDDVSEEIRRGLSKTIERTHLYFGIDRVIRKKSIESIIEETIEEAQQLRQKGKLQRALKLINGILEEHPDNRKLLNEKELITRLIDRNRVVIQARKLVVKGKLDEKQKALKNLEVFFVLKATKAEEATMREATGEDSEAFKTWQDLTQSVSQLKQRIQERKGLVAEIQALVDKKDFDDFAGARAKVRTVIAHSGKREDTKELLKQIQVLEAKVAEGRTKIEQDLSSIEDRLLTIKDLEEIDKLEAELEEVVSFIREIHSRKVRDDFSKPQKELEQKISDKKSHVQKVVDTKKKEIEIELNQSRQIIEQVKDIEELPSIAEQLEHLNLFISTVPSSKAQKGLRSKYQSINRGAIQKKEAFQQIIDGTKGGVHELLDDLKKRVEEAKVVSELRALGQECDEISSLIEPVPSQSVRNELSAKAEGVQGDIVAKIESLQRELQKIKAKKERKPAAERRKEPSKVRAISKILAAKEKLPEMIREEIDDAIGSLSKERLFNPLNSAMEALLIAKAMGDKQGQASAKAEVGKALGAMKNVQLPKEYSEVLQMKFDTQDKGEISDSKNNSRPQTNEGDFIFDTFAYEYMPDLSKISDLEIELEFEHDIKHRFIKINDKLSEENNIPTIINKYWVKHNVLSDALLPICAINKDGKVVVNTNFVKFTAYLRKRGLDEAPPLIDTHTGKSSNLLDSIIYSLILHEITGHFKVAGGKVLFIPDEKIAQRKRGNKYSEINLKAMLYFWFALCENRLGVGLEERVVDFLMENNDYFRVRGKRLTFEKIQDLAKQVSQLALQTLGIRPIEYVPTNTNREEIYAKLPIGYGYNENITAGRTLELVKSVNEKGTNTISSLGSQAHLNPALPAIGLDSLWLDETLLLNKLQDALDRLHWQTGTVRIEDRLVNRLRGLIRSYRKHIFEAENKKPEAETTVVRPQQIFEQAA